MLNIWFTADFHLGHKNIIRYYSLCAEALFYLNRCLRQLPSTSCLHPSELMHANMPDTIPFSWTRATPRYKLDKARYKTDRFSRRTP